MVGESLAECVSRHLNVEVEVICEPFQNSIYRVSVDGLVLGATTVGLASEHIITQSDIGGVLQIGDDCLPDCSVDGDVPVTLVLPGIACLLLEDGEAGLEC